VEFDPAKYVKAACAARLARRSVPRIHQLRERGMLPAVWTDAGHLFAVADVLRYCRARDRRRALRTVRA
jgi:hypothetical protein